MIRNSAHRWFVGLLASVLTLLSAPVAPAGQNTFTGGPAVGSGESAGLVAADPSNPYVVYAAFQSVLYRSGDGGSTWIRLRGGFNAIDALLVHPAESTTIFIGGEEGALPVVYRSTDSGATWTKTSLDDFIQVLAGDPEDPSTVYAGSASGRVWKSTDKGANWTSSQNLSGLVSQLVVDPHQRTNVYVGTEADFYYFNFGEFAKSTDSAATFVAQNPGPFENVSALAADPLSPAKLYMGLESGAAGSLDGFFSSSDGGTTWAHTGAGLPEKTISSIVADPSVLGTLYAGTPSGVFRSRDAGATWAPFGSRLGLSVNSLAMSGDGRFLHAGTNLGVFDLEFVQGAVDVAAGLSGDSRVLIWNDELHLADLNAAGQWSGGTFSGSSTTWTATAIGVGTDGDTRVLWRGHDGRWGLEFIGPLRDQIVTAPQISVDPVDIAVAADGKAWMLFTSITGQMFVIKMGPFDIPTFGHSYGPAAGWSAVAIADSSAGAWVLWRCTDGRAGLSLHDADGTMLGSFQWAASPGFAAEDISVGADGRVRLLRTSANAHAEVWTVDAAGQLTSVQNYNNFGYVPRKISAGADGLTRLLWNYAGGHASVWLLNPDNTVKEKHELPPQ